MCYTPKTCTLCITYVLECFVFLLISSPLVALHRESILGACAWTHPAHICSCSNAHVKRLAT